MKKDDFIKRVLTEAGVDPKFLTFTDDIDDAAVATYASNLMTRDRAESDPIVFGKIRSKAYAEALDGFDKDFVAFAESDLPKEVTDKLKAEKSTREKWNLIRAAIPKPGTETEAVKAYKNEIAGLYTQLKSKEAEVTKIKTESEGKLTNFQRDFMLSQEIGKLEIADTAKQYLSMSDIQIKFNEAIAKKGISLSLENNTLLPKVVKDGAPFDYYLGNEKQSLEQVLKTELAPYLKQSAGTGGKDKPAPPPAPGTPAPALTLQQINAEQVKKNFEKLKAERAQ